MAPTTRRATISTLVAIAAATALATTLTGCAVGALIGGAAESYRESSTRTVPAEFTGLTGKSFAVVISADRMIQADFPTIVPELTSRISQRLADNTGASGWVPPDALMTYLFNNPDWVARPFGVLASDLGVDRLVVIDLYEFRLNAPGNQYLWDGLAAGTLSVVAGSEDGGEARLFEREVRVTFPDDSGRTPLDFNASVVSSALMARFVDRASWPFYEHEEPFYPDY